ncbi:tripartite tricarboxylate transporter substrate binding protein [Limnohabitans sp. B9-3]|uniref:Bug family tripartite tricarboxylate transporter substrate binding protein n=1 Tax=Limnohabitans sp. B9-3 TaxID=1100707 RepID=UPI000C1E8AF2|nr:tripartite tricarboxylate transporter substrate binding protein [Limnohabitans sp. B9-3]PIT76485.1 TctC [Limnohabitans sp. B9-3]
MNFLKTSFVACVASAVVWTLPVAAQQAATFPTKPVNIVTAFAAGSGPDAVLRQVSDKLSKLWNQPVTITNKPGGGGFIAIDATQRMPADGYTLLQLDSEHLSALPLLYKSKNFVTLNTFDPVAPLFRTPFLVAVATDSKWQNMKDLIASAKSEPNKVSYGSWGIGSPGHLGGEQLELLTNSEMTHVAYREVSQLFTSVGAGDIQWSFASIPSSQGVFKAGKIRYLAVAASKRLPQMPDVPTVTEATGLAGFDVNSFVVLLSPKGLASDVSAKINADVLKVLADPEVKTRFNTFAFESLTWSPDEIRKNADAKSKIYDQLVKRKNISLD